MSGSLFYRNLFDSDFRLPEKVCILAPGPNGKAHYGRIPPDFCVVALSIAVLIPEVRAKVWMMNHADQSWFDRAATSFNGICVFGDAAMRARPELAGKCACYYFTPPPEPLEPDKFISVDGVIRVGGSIVGCALQLAYNFGAAEILLCGADLSGDHYWNGDVNQQPTHGDVWPAVRRVDPLIRWLMEEKKIKVSTLSPTRLNVPSYDF